MAELPGTRAESRWGTVTFLFTDIEGSTRLWEEHPRAMPGALARHDALLRRAIEAHGGRVFKRIGDQFCAAFASAADALSAAHAAQSALRSEPWGELGSLRVRMALHSGSAEERGDDYFGAALNRVARLLAAGHGGQILLSQAAADGAGAALPSGATLRDLGTHRLKDLQEPERILQFVHPEAPAEFPPLRSLEAFAHNLPRQTTRFIGRWPDMAAIRQLLSRAAILTLTGAGGCGKTRLALQVAAELVEAYADGVWLVEPAALSDAELLVPSVAAALGLREEPTRPILATLVDHLRPRSLLLLVDNCEHLLEPCGQLVDTLMRDCPRLRVLATSREALGVAGEQTYRVPSLSLPDAKQAITPDRLEQSEAVQLFRGASALLRSIRPTVVTLESQEGGDRYLLLEMIRQYAGEKLLESGESAALRRRHRDWYLALVEAAETGLPGPGRRECLERLEAEHPNLRAALDWCAAEEGEAEAEQRLAGAAAQFWASAGDVHEGGERLAAALSRPGGGQRTAERAKALLGAVMMQFQRGDYTAGLSLCKESLAIGQELGERAIIAHSLAGLGEIACLRGDYPGARQCCEEGLTIYQEIGEHQAAARMVGLLGIIAHELGDVERAGFHYEQGLAIARGLGDSASMVYLLDTLGSMARNQGHYSRARACHLESLAIHRQENNPEGNGLAFCLAKLGLVAHEQGDLAQALSLFEESLAICRRIESPRGIAVALICIAACVAEQGELVRARALGEESVAIYRELNDRSNGTWALAILAGIARQENDFPQAQALYEESLAMSRGMGQREGIAAALAGLADLELLEGAVDSAYHRHHESLALFSQLGYRRNIAAGIVGLARVAEGRGQPEHSARLLGAAQALVEAMGARLGVIDRTEQERCGAAVQAQLGEAAFATAWAEGQAMPLPQAIASALEEDRPT